MARSSLELTCALAVVSILPFHSSCIFKAFSLFVMILYLSDLIELMIPLKKETRKYRKTEKSSKVLSF